MRRVAFTVAAGLIGLLVLAVAFAAEIERVLAATVATTIGYRILRHRYFPKERK